MKRQRGTKFLQHLDEKNFTKLMNIADERGIIIQELIRSVVIPDWMRKHKDEVIDSQRGQQ